MPEKAANAYKELVKAQKIGQKSSHEEGAKSWNYYLKRGAQSVWQKYVDLEYQSARTHKRREKLVEKYSQLTDETLEQYGLEKFRADLRDQDLSVMNLNGYIFTDVVMTGATLDGANMKKARGVSIEQLALSVFDKNTILPEVVYE